MNRWRTFLVTVTVFMLVITGGLLFYIRELRREARHRRYLELSSENKEVTITIPEGWRREQIGVLLEKQGVTNAADFLAATKEDEGTLFPDTYRFFKLTTAKEVRAKMVDNYRAKAAQNIDRDTLIIASIVEREAKKPEERAGIAGVYWNRYRANLALTADPTVQYGRDTNLLKEKQARFGSEPSEKNDQEQNDVLLNFDFWGTITRNDYQGVDSLYNTYRNAGLPPTPICNPGLASIEAALNPEESNNLYFLHTSDGQIIYAKNIDEHNRNKQKYL
ncbi:MAG: endolytic transglycosylase MltG [bacterium]|nr:endolytic transglycosylase MltG [bacterium]